MPIKKYLDSSLTPEAAKAMVQAYAMAMQALEQRGIKDASATVAARVSALAHGGETDAERLTEKVLAQFTRTD